MTFKGYVSIFFLLVFLNTKVHLAEGQTNRAQCQKAVPSFLATPSRQGFDRLSQLGTCWEFVASSDAYLKELNDGLRRGNSWAARYVAFHLKQLGGGNLEDALVALGEFSEHNMLYLLLLRRQGLLSENELSDSLTMLPLSLTDNPEGQLNCVNRRRGKAAQVHRPDLSQERAQALSALDNFAAEIKANTSEAGH